MGKNLAKMANGAVGELKKAGNELKKEAVTKIHKAGNELKDHAIK